MYLEGGKIFHSKKLYIFLKVWFFPITDVKIGKNTTISGGFLSIYEIT